MLHGMGELILIRHGETAWSRAGRFTGRTDLPLTDAGCAASAEVAAKLPGRRLAAAFSSPLGRATHTASLAGLADVMTDPDLVEWDCGGYEGMTEREIREMCPGWSLWRDGVNPGDADHPGEQLQHVAGRADAVLDRVRPLLRDGDVAVVGHGHVQRVLAARWLGLDRSAGRLLLHPEPGSISILTTERDQPVLGAWNVP